MSVVNHKLCLVTGLIIASWSTASADVTTISGPIAAPFLNPDGTPADGTGMCMASAVSTDPAVDFGGLNEINYVGGMNAFIELHEADRDERVVRSVFDLSNNFDGGTQASYGDFQNADPDCPIGGCGFFVNDPAVSFGVRFRGYLNVTEEFANRNVQFGFYADDTVSLHFFDNNGARYDVLILAPQLGIPTWRMADTVRFEEPGIYPVEILYSEIAEHAALEMSYSFLPGADFERPAEQPPIVPLSDAGFQLFPETMFFQTLSGVPSFPDLGDCQQCNRSFVNAPGGISGCGAGYYCNEAALCASCDSAIFCGLTCSVCSGVAPHCGNPGGGGDYQCVECIESEDCQGGFTCNPDTLECEECLDDSDCPRGDTCVAGECTPCGTSDSCAGNSCNCCPTGAGGAQLECAPIDADGAPVCMECIRDSECAQGVCDVSIGRCVDGIDNCGDCPAESPFCLQGQPDAVCAECRFDTDCTEGNFCESGACRPCTTDRRCGSRCESCTGTEPYCRDGGAAELSICVQCEDDSQCDGGSCNLATNRCEPECSVTCDGATPFCLGGDRCVECYADVHCPCNGSCDQASNTCDSACRTDPDCMGYEHCDDDERVCKLGANAAQAPTGCICNVAVGHPGTGGGAPGGLILALLGALALLIIRRQRPGPGRSSPTTSAC